GTNPRIIDRSDQFGEDVLIGILAGAGIPGLVHVGGVVNELIDGSTQFAAKQPLEEAGCVEFAPVGDIANRVKIGADGECSIECFVVDAGTAILDAFEIGSDRASIVGVAQEGLGVIGFLELEATSDLNGWCDKVEEVLDIIGIAPAGGVVSKR